MNTRDSYFQTPRKFRRPSELRRTLKVTPQLLRGFCVGYVLRGAVLWRWNQSTLGNPWFTGILMGF